jgi:glutamine synthetase
MGGHVVVEGAKGECNLGQHEIAFLYDEVVRTCDNHVIYKTAAKEIAAAHGQSITFMAKYDEREGNSCHIHLSLRGPTARSSSPTTTRPQGRPEQGLRPVPRRRARDDARVLLLLCPEHQLLQAIPAGSFAPTAIAWGRDNRTCALRVVGHGAGLRMENRVPGGDVNPYLAVGAMLAGGLHGIENELKLEPAFVGNAYAADVAHVPTTLAEARDLLAGSAIARAASATTSSTTTSTRRHRDRGLQCRRHGLGTRPWLRAALRPTREST